MKRALIAVAVGAATALLAAPTAGADDDTFYAQLAELWGLPHDDLLIRADSLAVGYGMCTDMRDGVPREMTARSWHMRFRDSSTMQLANQMAYLAQSELCPDTAE
ncbi:membrane protein [Mycobacterium Phage Niklas]|uniref:Membrane protein n=1 Tax=Mycobacterium Phage Niklas TaxID=2517936 RepID=A0A482JFY2_9CAUD|nr:membrane protein [Mycobacterium Phage Niklas]QBP31624.1 membrane protein [Mycobacterium Phage Niklas]